MENLDDLQLFLLVAQQRSFTRAAAQAGISASAVSHSIKKLETRLKAKLLQRSTRSVALTRVGEQLFSDLTPLMHQIQHTLNALGQYQNSLCGTLRINGTENMFCVLWAKFDQFMRQYPEVKLELIADMRFIDIVAQHFDIGIRFGDDIAKDMIAVRVSADITMAVVGSTDYFSTHNKPLTPHDLIEHQTIALRLPTYGGLLPWEFKQPHTEKVIKFQPTDKFVTNSPTVFHQAVRSGQGLIWTPLEQVSEDIAAGKLIEVLTDWRMVYPGYHLYYPNRRANEALFTAFVEAMRYRN